MRDGVTCIDISFRSSDRYPVLEYSSRARRVHFFHMSLQNLDFLTMTIFNHLQLTR